MKKKLITIISLSITAVLFISTFFLISAYSKDSYQELRDEGLTEAQIDRVKMIEDQLKDFDESMEKMYVQMRENGISEEEIENTKKNNAEKRSVYEQALKQAKENPKAALQESAKSEGLSQEEMDEQEKYFQMARDEAERIKNTQNEALKALGKLNNKTYVKKTGEEESDIQILKEMIAAYKSEKTSDEDKKLFAFYLTANDHNVYGTPLYSEISELLGYYN